VEDPGTSRDCGPPRLAEGQATPTPPGVPANGSAARKRGDRFIYKSDDAPCRASTNRN